MERFVIRTMPQAQQRPAAALCQRRVVEGFQVVADPSKKARRYRLKDVLEQRIAGRE